MFIDCILFHKDFFRGMKKKGYETLTGNMSRSGFTSETTNVSEGCHCHVASLHRFPLASVAAGKYPSFYLWIVDLYCGRFYFCLMAFLSCYCVVLFLKFMNLLSCSSMTSLSSRKTAPYPVFIIYTIRLYWFSFTFFSGGSSLTFQLIHCKLASRNQC